MYVKRYAIKDSAHFVAKHPFGGHNPTNSRGCTSSHTDALSFDSVDELMAFIEDPNGKEYGEFPYIPSETFEIIEFYQRVD